jgi:hypothetical protein
MWEAKARLLAALGLTEMKFLWSRGRGGMSTRKTEETE